jgi:hypothetical protein
MKFIEYLMDRIGLILFFIILLLFFTGVIYFDNTGTISDSNIPYLVSVSTILFVYILLLTILLQAAITANLKHFKPAKTGIG